MEKMINDLNEHIDNDAGEKTWSKVSTKTANAWVLDKRLWIIAAAILVLIFLVIFSGSKKAIQQPETKSAILPTDNSVLDQNLLKIKNLSKTINTTNQQLLAQDDFAHDDRFAAKQSKELLVRQNAPTSMFSASSNVTSFNNQKASAGSNQGAFAGQGVYTAFANQSMTTSSVSAKKIAYPNATIVSGEFLHAILETAINSDLPGQIRAVVSQPVYAYVGEKPLIPAGSRLIGQYTSSVLQGQNRVFVIWNRVILPNGISAQINSPGEDEIGIAGQNADDVNTHFFARFGEASLLSIIGAGAAAGGVNTNDQYNSASQYRMALAQSFQQSASNALQGSLQIKPTLSVDQGAQINVFVARDINFKSVMKMS